jgi:hypothetical protein
MLSYHQIFDTGNLVSALLLFKVTSTQPTLATNECRRPMSSRYIHHGTPSPIVITIFDQLTAPAAKEQKLAGIVIDE